MFNNYYFLKQLSKELDTQMKGYELVTAFSQSKDELIMGFVHGMKEFWLRASLEPNLNLLTFPRDFNRSKRNSVELFTELIGKKVLGVTQYKNERIFSLEFEDDWAIYFKMFGNRSNLLLAHQKKVVRVFQKRHADDQEMDLLHLDRDLDQSKEGFLQNGLKSTFPTLGREALSYLKSKGFNEESPEQQWSMLSDLLQLLENPKYYVSKVDEAVQFLLFPWGEVMTENSSAFDAANDFFFSFSKRYFLDREKQPATKELQKKISKTQNYIQKSYHKLDEINKKARYEEIANIIMANLHQIPPRTKKITLFDFYHEQDIVVKLNESLSPQKNAENYYRRAKNQKLEVKNIELNLEKKETEVETLKNHLDQIEPIENLRELRKYFKANGLEDLQKEKAPFPFRKFEFMDYEIWVGKNASNNDLLTQRYAKKNDLWLHARDVSGSHVVIKWIAGRNFPMNLIEKAAEIAAYYSQRKTDSLCPVIYTPKKFVRKRKGDPPGAVVIDREQVIMVEPMLSLD